MVPLPDASTPSRRTVWNLAEHITEAHGRGPRASLQSRAIRGGLLWAPELRSRPNKAVDRRQYMDLSKLSKGDQIIGVSGIALFIFSLLQMARLEGQPPGDHRVRSPAREWSFTLALIRSDHRHRHGRRRRVEGGRRQGSPSSVPYVGVSVLLGWRWSPACSCSSRSSRGPSYIRRHSSVDGISTGAQRSASSSVSSRRPASASPKKRAAQLPGRQVRQGREREHTTDSLIELE